MKHTYIIFLIAMGNCWLLPMPATASDYVVNSALELINPDSDEEIKGQATSPIDGNSWTAPDTVGAFSDAESQWLSKHPIIKFGHLNDRSPFEFVNKDNKMDGVNRAVLDFIALKTGISFTFHPYNSHLALLDALTNNEVDFISTVYERSQQWLDLTLTYPYWHSNIAAISNDGNGYDCICAMTGKKVAIDRDSNYKHYVVQIIPNAKLVEVTSVGQGISHVASGRADIYIGNILAAAHEIKQNTYQNLTMNVIDALPVVNPRFAIRGDFTELASIIDRAVLQISSEERLLLFEQWLQQSLAADEKYHKLLQTVVPLTIVVTFIIGCFIYWNRRLQQEIELRLMLQQKFEHQSRHDELTGLPNRTRLKEIIDLKLSQHRQSSDKLLCLFVDINDFKPINDNYGHDIGDLLLVKFGRRLINRLRRDDFASRFGGDEFVIIASLKDPTLGSEAITKMVHNIYSDPIIIDDLEVNIACSIGGAIFPDDGDSIKKLIKVADQRMYEDKKRQRGNKTTTVRVHNS